MPSSTEATATAVQFVRSRLTRGPRKVRSTLWGDSFDVELFGDRGLVADQLRDPTEVRQLVAERDEPEPVLRAVRDPDVALGQTGQVLAQLLERRLRVEQVPDQDPGDHAYILNTPKVVSGIGAFRAAARPRASTRRVSSGSMIPSSQRRAVE